MNIEVKFLEKEIGRIETLPPLFQIAYIPRLYALVVRQELSKLLQRRLEVNLAKILSDALTHMDKFSAAEIIFVFSNIRNIPLSWYSADFDKLKSCAEKYAQIRHVQVVFREIEKIVKSEE